MVRVIIKEEGHIMEVELNKGVVVIGRQSDCDIVLRDAKLSRKHCEITFEGGKFFVRDCGSKNGTFLNDNILKEKKEISIGDKIQVGNAIIIFEKEVEGRDYKARIKKEIPSVPAKDHVIPPKDVSIYTRETETGYEKKEKQISYDIERPQNELHIWVNVGRGMWAFFQTAIVIISIIAVLTLIILLFPRKSTNIINAMNLIKSNPSFEDFENYEKPKSWYFKTKDSKEIKTYSTSSVKKVGEKSLAIEFFEKSEPRKFVICAEDNINLKGLDGLKIALWTRGKDFDGWISVQVDWFLENNRAVALKKQKFDFRKVGISWRREEFTTSIPNLNGEFRLNVIVFGKSGTVFIDDVSCFNEKVPQEKLPSEKFSEFCTVLSKNGTFSIVNSNNTNEFYVDECGYGLFSPSNKIYSLPTESPQDNQNISFDKEIISYLINPRNLSKIESTSKIARGSFLVCNFSLRNIIHKKDTPFLFFIFKKTNKWLFKLIRENQEIEESIEEGLTSDKVNGIRILGSQYDLLINFLSDIAEVSLNEDEDESRYVMLCNLKSEQKGSEISIGFHIELLDKKSKIKRSETEIMYYEAIALKNKSKYYEAIKKFKDIIDKNKDKPKDKYVIKAQQEINVIMNECDDDLRRIKTVKFLIEISGSITECNVILNKINELLSFFEGDETITNELNEHKKEYENLREKITIENKEKQALEIFKRGYLLLEEGEVEKGLLILEQITKDYTGTKISEKAKRIIEQGGL